MSSSRGPAKAKLLSPNVLAVRAWNSCVPHRRERDGSELRKTRSRTRKEREEMEKMEMASESGRWRRDGGISPFDEILESKIVRYVPNVMFVVCLRVCLFVLYLYST